MSVSPDLSKNDGGYNKAARQNNGGKSFGRSPAKCKRQQNANDRQNDR